MPDAILEDAPPEEEERFAVRRVHPTEWMEQAASQLQRPRLIKTPKSISSHMATEWAEAIEGSIAGNERRGFLARYRCKLLLAPVQAGTDRNDELKRRLHLWEGGGFEELMRRLLGQQAATRRRGNASSTADESEEMRGRRAKQKTAAGSVSKALKGLVGGVASGSPADRKKWTTELIRRGCDVNGIYTTEGEVTDAKACAWGAGDVKSAQTEMRQAGKPAGGRPGIPWVRLPPLSAPGPSGERPEHLEDIINSSGASQRRCLMRALDALTIGWATNTLPTTCRWLLNTQVLFLMKGGEAASKDFDDEEWLQCVPDAQVAEEGPEVDVDDVVMSVNISADDDLSKKRCDPSKLSSSCANG